jgi:large subunit ribosomal protein L4
VVADLEYSEPKTKTFASMLKNMDCDKSKVLFVLDKPNPAVVKSARNIPGVKVTLGNMVATYDVVWADRIILTESALALMEEVLKDE